MNLLHLKYAVEIDKTRSINKAAEKLFVSQPNLSRAIKELEESVGITIFRRTHSGMCPTEQGQIFLAYAKNILLKIDELESLYNPKTKNKTCFSVSVPRASYISKAFTDFLSGIENNDELEIYYKETNSHTAINNILYEDYNLGIIRYRNEFEQYFSNMLKDKKLSSRTISGFRMLVLMSENSPLAKLDKINIDELSSYIEIAHGDPYVPSLQSSDLKKTTLSDDIHKRIFVFERGSQFEILNNLTNSYMWVSPVPDSILKRYNLIQKQCTGNLPLYKDVLIYNKDYHFTETDNMFIEMLGRICSQVNIDK